MKRCGGFMNTISSVPNQAPESLGSLSQQNAAKVAQEALEQPKVMQQSEASVSATQVNEVVSELREFLGSQESMSFNIRIDESLREPVIQIVEQNSGESVKQIPTEQALQISRAILEMRGLFVDESA